MDIKKNDIHLHLKIDKSLNSKVSMKKSIYIDENLRVKSLFSDMRKLRKRMCRIVCVSIEDFNKSRRYPLPYARAIVVDDLIKKGYTYTDCSKLIGLHPRSLIYECNNLHSVINLKQYDQVSTIYNKYHGNQNRP